MPTILALESSCDDTGAAVLDNGQILSNVVSSQKIHARFGGVVPELASRQHQGNIVPVVQAALEDAGFTAGELDAIAFAQGPGLMGSLLVGVSFAKAFALGLGKPLLAVDHLHAHLLAHWIDTPKPEFPFLCLLVSGGHTQLVRMDSPLSYEIIGKTIDDAAGEAFDKGAKMLGLPYPGGPLIDKYAKEGDYQLFSFPVPQLQGYDFSFSGLKTSLLYFIRKQEDGFVEENLADICASYQHTIVGYLLHKLEQAAADYGITQVGIAGGVSANSELRRRFEELARSKGWTSFIPKFEYCTDNAAMIAMAGHFMYKAGAFAGQDITPYARK